MSDAAVVTEETPGTADYEKYLVFSILDKLYSFPSRLIGEIALFDSVYPLPLMPSYVLGVVNRYSIPYALFDIGLFFYKTPTPRNKIIVFKEEIDRIAILIDDVTGITDIQNEDLLTIERSVDSSEVNDLTEAVYGSFKMDGKDVFALDVHKILARVSGEIL